MHILAGIIALIVIVVLMAMGKEELFSDVIISIYRLFMLAVILGVGLLLFG